MHYVKWYEYAQNDYTKPLKTVWVQDKGIFLSLSVQSSLAHTDAIYQCLDVWLLNYSVVGFVILFGLGISGTLSKIK